MLTPYLFIRRFGKAINIDTNNIPLSVLVYAFLSFALVSLMLFMYLLLIVSSKWFHSRGSEDYFELTSIGIKFDDGMSFYLIPFENIKEICEGSYFLIIKTRGRSNFSIPKRLFSDPIVKRGFVQEVRLLMKNARNSWSSNLLTCLSHWMKNFILATIVRLSRAKRGLTTSFVEWNQSYKIS